MACVEKVQPISGSEYRYRGRRLSPDNKLSRMNYLLRTIAIFLVSLFLADQVSNVLLNASSAQYSAHLEGAAWWPPISFAFEGIELIIYTLVFGLTGALFARLFEKREFAIVLALMVGAGYSVLAFANGPDYPFVRYSHAPYWLWALAWSFFYVPAISAALGVVIARTLKHRRSWSEDAA
jgi:hypothetical protein